MLDWYIRWSRFERSIFPGQGWAGWMWFVVQNIRQGVMPVKLNWNSFDLNIDLDINGYDALKLLILLFGLKV